MTDGWIADRPLPGALDSAVVEQLSAQLRRRREASWRLPPLEDGPRDPVSRFVG